LSNRAACHLQESRFEQCIDDCSDAFEIVASESIRCKLLYRRAKARFLLTEVDNTNKQLLQEAAKDLLQLLSLEPKNQPGATLLKTIRAKHDLTKGTPLSQTLQAIQDNVSDTNSYNTLLGLLQHDEISSALEFGRRGGIQKMIDIGTPKAIQVLQCACACPKFVQQYGNQISQARLLGLMTGSDEQDLLLPCLAVWLRLVLYLDPLESMEQSSLIDDSLLLKSCLQGLSEAVLPATLDVLSSWTTENREAIVSKASSGDIVPLKLTDADLRRKAPREVAAIRKQEYERQQRDKLWAKQRALYFCKEGGMSALLQVDINRHQVGVVLGRIFSSIQDEEECKSVVKPWFESFSIQEVSEEKHEEQMNRDYLVKLCQRAQLVTALLVGQPTVGTWAFQEIRHDLTSLIASNDFACMLVVSELLSAAASVEQARSVVAGIINTEAVEPLLEHPEQAVRSGAASAIAKLGLADKNAKEGDVMELLHIAAELLMENKEEAHESLLVKISIGSTTQATTSVERGMEIISYLASRTMVKEELAHGYKPSVDATQSTLQRLVELVNTSSDSPVSAYALASTFSLIAVSNETLRREAFEGKEFSMEQYDELQALGKTEEEKQAVPQGPDDTTKAVEERIEKLAAANVPRAMVKLTEEASDTTLEKLAIGMNRMAVVTSVRGLLIQQGVLSACIKIEWDEKSSDIQKNTAKQAHQCIAKLLVSTNPSILTTSQRIGAIKPLMKLIRDSSASDLQHFEALLAITNLASTGNDAKDKVVSERGISDLSYAMFSSHPMVRRAGTEAMCNLIPHPAMMKHLNDPENLRLWLAFASDYEENFECARAAAGCLAMTTDVPEIASALVTITSFRESVNAMLQSGKLELMHRVLVMVQNLIDQGGPCQEAVANAGVVVFCRAYVESYHDGSKASELDFSSAELGLMTVTVELAKEIVNKS
jgi:hypothetical protein